MIFSQFICCNNSNSKNGFTLVEVMVVVTIIVLLASIAIPNLLRARIETNEATAKTTLKTISSSLESYYAQNNVYPNDTTSLISATPPYLNRDFFTGGGYNGYTYSADLTIGAYTITAVPVSSSTGNHSYTISTGAVLTVN